MKVIKIINTSLISEYLLFLVLSMVIPFVIHSVPWQGKVPLGAIVLAMFYTPLIAVILSRYRMAIFLSLFSSPLNFLITGHPVRENIIFLTIELTMFSLILVFLYRKNKSFFLNPIIGYLASIFITFCFAILIPVIISPRIPLDFLIGTIFNSFFGLMILGFISLIIGKNING